MESPKMLHKNNKIAGTQFIKDHKFSCGKEVPIFEVQTMQGLNQLVGKVKFNNSAYGLVFYRGETKLHDSLIPAIFRGRKNCNGANSVIKTLKKKILADKLLSKFINVDFTDDAPNYAIEGILQHYGIATRFLDVVDNLWIALWMGLYTRKNYKIKGKYFRYIKRELPLIEPLRHRLTNEEDLYQYIYLISIPYAELKQGVIENESHVLVDLRQSLPSTFVRPHAQHAIVMRKKVHGDETIEKYDMATDVVGIIRVRIDVADKWLGDGQLLTQDNLFPPPAYDTGYDILLHRADIFTCINQQIDIYI